MSASSRLGKRLALALALGVLLVPLSYFAIVFCAWLTDSRNSLGEPSAGSTDFSRLSRAHPARVLVPDSDPDVATEQLRQLVRDAALENKKITVAGSRHSMGGHTLLDNSLAVDMRCPAFRRIGPVQTRARISTVQVGAGATWHELLTALDRAGWSVAVMQSNDDFTIGGSLSVNCHGWQPFALPIVSTVEGFRILLDDGSVRECRRDRAEDRELFDAACGGYGLLGIVLEVELHVVPNVLYQAEEFPATSANYAARFAELVRRPNDNVGLAYGRVSIAPGPWFLRDARIIRFVSANPDRSAVPIDHTFDDSATRYAPAPWEIDLARAVFRASGGSDFGKLGRWAIERVHGQTHHVVSRNGILRTPSDWFGNRDPQYTEILHEYFVPPARFSEFLEHIRPLLRSRDSFDLLNVTVRAVQRDDRTILAYARQDVFGLVMLFRYRADAAADERLRAITQQLIAAALACDGSYYLPYRPHATVAQFRQAYPRWREFLALKRRYDPHEVFENAFYLRYLAGSPNG